MSDDARKELGPDELRAKARDVIAALQDSPEQVERFQQDPVAAVTSLGFPEYAAEEFVQEVGRSLHAEVQAYIGCQSTTICHFTCYGTAMPTAIDPIDGGEGEVLSI